MVRRMMSCGSLARFSAQTVSTMPALGSSRSIASPTLPQNSLTVL